MENWIIRINAPSISVDDKRVVIRSQQRVSIKPDDVLLVLSEMWEFTHQGVVVSVAERKGTLETGGEKRWWDIGVAEWELLPQRIDLDLFSTSLTFIRNWTRPKVHVRRGYRRLPAADLVTIQRGEAFLAREAYLTLSSALPTTLFQQFLFETTTTTTPLRYTREYADRATALMRFVENHVLSLGRTLVDAQAQWEALIQKAEIADPGAVYVWDEEDAAPPINLSSQAQLFRTLLFGDHKDANTQLAQFAEITEILSARNQRPDEVRFERIFQDRVDERR